MSSLIYLSYQQQEVVFNGDFQFIVLANGLDLISEENYRLMMGQFADIFQTEKAVSVTRLTQWCEALNQELAHYLTSQHQAAENISDTLQKLNTLLLFASQNNAQTLISCCV